MPVQLRLKGNSSWRPRKHRRVRPRLKRPRPARINPGTLTSFTSLSAIPTTELYRQTELACSAVMLTPAIVTKESQKRLPQYLQTPLSGIYFFERRFPPESVRPGELRGMRWLDLRQLKTKNRDADLCLHRQTPPRLRDSSRT